MQRVWLVEYILCNSGEGRDGFRIFRNKDDAYKEKFEVDYDFFKKELEKDLELEKKCKDPEYAKEHWREPVTDDFGIHLCMRALEHIERVNNLNVSWEEKYGKLWEAAIPWDDEPDSNLVTLGSTCCTNLAPDVRVYELDLE